jgi:hypothetical protein
MEIIELQGVKQIIVFYIYDIRKQKNPTIPLEVVVGVPVVGSPPPVLGL